MWLQPLPLGPTVQNDADRERVRSAWPYRLMRHPIDAGFGLAMLGVVAFLVLFIPSGIYRARGEEVALSRKFGREWKEHSRG